MLSKRRKLFPLPMLLLVLVGAADCCAASQSPCELDGNLPRLTQAVCTGDYEAIAAAPDYRQPGAKMPAVVEGDSFTIRKLLLRLYRRDLSTGRNLPWATIATEGVQAAIGVQLARGLRARMFELDDGPLIAAATKSMDSRDVAVRKVAMLTLGNLRYDAVVSTLKRRALTARTSLEREAAVGALGVTCTESSRAALLELMTLTKSSSGSDSLAGYYVRSEAIYCR